MNGAILIDFATVLLCALLVFQSIRYKVLYIKPFVGLGMFIIFGVAFIGIAAGPTSVALLPSLLIASLGMLIGLGWVFEGLDRPSYSKKGEK